MDSNTDKKTFDVTPEELRELAQKYLVEKATLEQLQEALTRLRIRLKRERLPGLFGSIACAFA